MKPTLILVDDVKQFRDRLKNALRDYFEILGEAENGKQAVEFCQNLMPQLVLMDVIMPGMSGIEALSLIRKMPDPPQVVMLSGLKSESVVQRALSLGAFDYLFKPSEDKIIRELLLEALRKK